MIENRMRVEKQIYAGRQEIRSVVKARNRSRPREPRSLLLPPQPTNDAPKLQPVSSHSPPPTSSDRPLGVDTDAENAFSGGSRWFYRRGRHTQPPSPGVSRDNYDPLLSPSIRKKWATGLLEIPTAQSDRARLEDRDGEPSKVQPSSSAGSFFSRLRNNSISSLTMAIQGRKSRVPSDGERSQDGYASESSSDESIPDDYLSHRPQRDPMYDDEDDGGPEQDYHTKNSSSSDDV